MRPPTALLVFAAALIAATSAGAATQKVTLTPALRQRREAHRRARLRLGSDRVLQAARRARGERRGVRARRPRWAWPLRGALAHPGFARGTHRVYATQHCESGMDGSPILVTRHADLRVT